MKQGLFISFEGMDGSGKSTQIAALEQFLKEEGYECLVTREPGGSPIGEKIRSLLLDPSNQEMLPDTEALLYAASRAQHVGTVIRPALDNGVMVLTDRYLDSSFAYQGFGRELGGYIDAINKPFADTCLPDLTIYLDVSPDIGMDRVSSRAPGEQDRIELENDAFKNRVYDGFQFLAKRNPERILWIDGTQERDIIQSIIRDAVKKKLEEESSHGL